MASSESQPLSNSVRKGQTAIVCQVCESEPKLKWKCLQCELTMCQNCRDKIHPKFVSTKEHTIIDIKDISKYEKCDEPKPDFTKLKCELHDRQVCCLYCQTCQQLVCQTCIAKKHNKHEFVEIIDEYKTRLDKIKNGQGNIENEIQNLKESKNLLEQVKSTRESQNDEIKQKILQEEKVLLNKVKEHTAKLINELDLKWEAFSKSVGQMDDELKEKLKNGEKQYTEIGHLFKPSNVDDVFSLSDFWFVLEDKSFPAAGPSFYEVPHYDSGDEAKLTPTLGKLKYDFIPYNNIHKFETEL